MTTYVRPAASARDDADMIAGWNISPNTGYTLQLSVSASGAVVLLLSANESTLIGSGTTSIGAAQPVTITPVSGQAVDMADPSLGWHLLLTTDGTEGARSITMDPIVDLPARTHPVYADDGLSLAVATADINAGTHYTQGVTASCPLGFGAGVGDTVSVPVDGSAVIGQVESITWSGTPDGSTAQVVIREHIQIRPDAYVVPVPPTPPTVADDTATTDAATTTSGNVLTNDSGGTLTVSAVNDLAANVGQIVAGSNGGDFVINADGSWTFDPGGDFAALTGSDTATTSVTYHASDGTSEAMATLAVTVSSAAAGATQWTPAEVSTALWLDAADSSTITLNGSTVSQWADKSGNGRHAAQETAGAQPSRGTNVVTFDGANDWMLVSLNLSQPITYYVVCKTNVNTGSSGSRQYVFDGADTAGVKRNLFSLRGNQVNKPSIWATNWVPHTANTTTGTNLYTLRFNGASSSIGINATVVTGNAGAYNQTDGMVLGANHLKASDFLSGDICEIVAVSSPSAVIEGYLAHKWDALLNMTMLVNALPTDHPYKSAAPTI